MKHGYFRHVVVVTLLSLLLQHKQPSVNAMNLPSRKIRVDQRGNPRLACLLGKSLGIGTRLITQGSVTESRVTALSNRALLRGNVKEISVHIKNAALVKDLRIQGSNLQLGWWPLLFTSLPFIWVILRPPVFTVLCLLWCLMLYTSGEKESNSQDNGPTQDSFLHQIRKRLNGKPCFLTYDLVLSNDNVARSRILRFGLRSILRSLMMNSVLKVAAAAADTMTMLNSAENNCQPSVGDLALASESSTFAATNRQQQQLVCTKLLEATDFELTKTTFDDNHMVLDADAVFPDGTQQTRLSYTLRTLPKPIVLDSSSRHALAFSNPECRLSLEGTLVEKFIPAMWVSVGPGVALPLKRNHRIVNVNVNSGECRMRGRWHFFQKDTPRRGVQQFLSWAQPRPALPPPKD